VVMGLAFYFLADWLTLFYKKPLALKYLKISALLILLVPTQELIGSMINILEKFKALALGKTLFPLVNIIILITLSLITKQYLLSALIALISAQLITLAYYLLAIKSNLKLARPEFNKEIMPLWLPLLGGNLFKNSMQRLPAVILGKFLSAAEIGIFEIADKSARTFYSLTDPYINIINVRLINIAHQAKENFVTLLNRSIKHLSIILFTLTGVIIFIAPFLINVFFGAKYNGAIPLFKLLVFYCLLGLSNFFQKSVYLIKEQTKYFFFFQVIFSCVQVLLFIFLVPSWGLLGTGMALILGRAFGLILAYYFVLKLGVELQLRMILWPAIIFVLLITPIYLTPWPVLLKAVSFLLAYISTMQLFRFIDLQDKFQTLKTQKGNLFKL
jgi:O-antigen/teichoic acid export membrane protein